MILNYEEWVDKYNPILNSINDNASFEGLLWETYGEEVKKVLSYPREQVWTLIEVDDNMIVIPGYHLVNRLGYFITDIPYDILDTETLQVYLEDILTQNDAYNMVLEYVEAHYESDANIIDLETIKNYFNDNRRS
jgi:hypothetical protein